MKVIKVAELFAGVGGFRLGLDSDSTGKDYKIVWSNQWEPGSNVQHASNIYVQRFGEAGHSNQDIAKVKVEDILDHDLLVGGFPCQDYSVARTLSQAKGLIGKKGVLWWEIYRIVKDKKNPPKFLMLENVDRLLKSPAKQRGRDFAVMISSLSDLGYAVEWRVINAADYGMPQRRRRVFIMAYRNNTKIYKKIKDFSKWILKVGIIAKAFPVIINGKEIDFEIKGSLDEISNNFNLNKKNSPFKNAGIIVDRKVLTADIKSDYNGPYMTLREVLVSNKEVPSEFFIKEKDLFRWKKMKGAKNEERVSKSGHKYQYSEGSMIFPDKLDKPSRTIVTGEGGLTPSRFKHVVKVEGKLRRLIPVELERLNMFPDKHTEGVSNAKRAFLMGNALVVGVIKKLSKELIKEWRRK